METETVIGKILILDTIEKMMLLGKRLGTVVQQLRKKCKIKNNRRAVKGEMLREDVGWF